MTDPTAIVAAAAPAPTAAVAAAAVSTMIHGRFIAGIALALLLLGVIYLLHKQNRSPSSYDLTDLLLGDDGKASPSRHVLFGSFFITSWVVVYDALTNHLTDTIFAAYVAAWVVPIVTVIVAKKMPQPEKGA